MGERDRALHVLIELQAMAAYTYWLADSRRDAHFGAMGTEYENFTLGVAIRTQLQAAALSRLVRVGLGLEEP